MGDFEFDRHTAVQLVRGNIKTDNELEFKGRIRYTINLIYK